MVLAVSIFGMTTTITLSPSLEASTFVVCASSFAATFDVALTFGNAKRFYTLAHTYNLDLLHSN
jgi:hypothetical protein